MPSAPLTLAHVTHEAVEQIGGIGTVLAGLISSPVYQQHVGRSILIGPVAPHLGSKPDERLGPDAEVLYSSIDQIDRADLAHRLGPVESVFDVKFIYGKRKILSPGDRRVGEAEILLIDVFNINHDRLNAFKFRLWERFGLDSSKYEQAWDYEEYIRLAEPAFCALETLLDDDQLPCILFAHEFMGMPAALQVILEGRDDFRTVFHAHECATARRLVEAHPGHDVMFYNVLDQARAQGLYVDDVFDGTEELFRHALIRLSHLCDGIIAVGDRVADEIKFLADHFDDHPIDVVYNGLPASEVSLDQKNRSRGMLLEYTEALLGHTPDVLMTHVTRPVISKGLWRDLQVCHELDPILADRGQTGVLLILTSAGGTRRISDIANMEAKYDWPRHHHHGYPDLVGPEIDLHHHIEEFNARHQNIQIILINQFGWTRSLIGTKLPESMNFADLRRATDVEFGMATYEPFGISPLEPLGSGAICVISSVCGCEGFVEYVNQGQPTPCVIKADYTQIDKPQTIGQLKQLSQEDRERIERRVAADIANQLSDRLATTEKDRALLLETSRELNRKMGWDQVAEHQLLPMLRRITQPAGRQTSVDPTACTG